MVSRDKLLNNVPDYNSKKRYFVNQIVLKDGIQYQNITGGNGDPASLIDWVSLTVSGGGGSTWYESYFAYTGGIKSVPSGFKGTVRNLDNPQAQVTNSVLGTSLTVTAGASSGDSLLVFGIY